MTNTELVKGGLELDDIRDAMCRIRSYIPRTPESRGVMSFLDDFCRGEPRGGKHPLGRFPEIVDLAGVVRAPWHIVWAPVNRLKGQAWNKYYLPSLPCIVEAISRETEANHLQNHATHRVLKNPRPDVLDSFIEACDVQIAETRTARAVAVSMKATGRVD